MTLITSGLAIAGLLAMSIPILIHLLARQRRTPVRWAAMRFLLEAYRKHRRRLQIEQFLLLAVRCLILALFGAALARPILDGATFFDAGGDHTAIIVLDDGLASNVMADDDVRAFDQLRQDAIRFVESLSPADRVSVVRAARPAEATLVPPVADHTAVIDHLRDLEPRAAASDLDAALRLAAGQLDDVREAGNPATIFLASEFRSGSAALDNPLPTLANEGTSIRLVATAPATKTPANVQITAIEPIRRVVLAGSASDGPAQVLVSLRRHGGTLGADVTRVRLAGEGLVPTEPRAVNWSPGQTTADVEFMIDVDAADDRQIALTARIDRDALDLDNERHILIDLRDRLRILQVDRRRFGSDRSIDRLAAGAWLHRALEPLDDGPMDIVDVEPAALDIADTRLADVVLLVRPDLLTSDGWSLLQQYVEGGGLVVIFPPGELNVHQWTERLNTALQLDWRVKLEVEDSEEGFALSDTQPASEVLRLLSSELPVLAPPVRVYRRLLVEGDGQSARPLLTYADDAPFILAGTPATADGGDALGLVMLMTSTPELAWTNLPSKPLMVPLVHELVRQGLGTVRGSTRYEVGETPALRTVFSDARSLTDADGDPIAVTEDGRPSEPLAHPGVYAVRDRGQQPMGMLAVNVDADAGDVAAQSAADVDLWLQASGDWTMLGGDENESLAGDDNDRTSIAFWLLCAVLLLLVLETLLARWFSHVSGTRRVFPGMQGSVRGTMEGTT